MRLSERAYLKVTAAAPPAAAARMDLLRAGHFSAGPLNGQRHRQQIVRDLVAAVRFDEVIETGTFRGTTTLFFSHLTGLPVYSVELLPRFLRFARVRCANEPTIQLEQGDSRAFLRRRSAELRNHTTLFYLDAHWEQDVPRFEEVEIISSAWRRAVVMIDDVAVADDPGYGFTHYGGVPLNLDYLPNLPGWGAFQPAAPASAETGARRGCVVLTSPDVSSAVEGVTSLRPVARQPLPA